MHSMRNVMVCPLSKNVITCSPNTASPAELNASSNTGSNPRLGVGCFQSSHEILANKWTVGSKCYHNYAKPAS